MFSTHEEKKNGASEAIMKLKKKIKNADLKSLIFLWFLLF